MGPSFNARNAGQYFRPTVGGSLLGGDPQRSLFDGGRKPAGPGGNGGEAASRDVRYWHVADITLDARNVRFGG